MYFLPMFYTNIKSNPFQIFLSITKRAVSYLLHALDVACLYIGYLGLFRLMSFSVTSFNSFPSTTIILFLTQQKLCKTQQATIIRGAYCTPTFIFLRIDHLFFNILNAFSIHTRPFFIFSSYTF